ncbi:MAG: peroxidase, partial [Pseudomonadota bacterium]|nr:peroxidase [Pseudomonadota bacterium]
MNYQTGILNPIPLHARYMMFTFEPESDDLSTVLEPLLELVDGDSTVAGLGPSLLAALGKDIPGLRSFPSISGPGFDIPATQYSLWLWLRGNDRGELHLRSRR